MPKIMRQTLMRLIPLLVLGGYLAAVAVPCPAPVETVPAGISTSHSHHEGDEEALETGPGSQAAMAFLSEPCPCGCEGATGGTMAAKRLGKLVLSEPAEWPVAEAPSIDTPHQQAVPEFAALPPERVPILG